MKNDYKTLKNKFIMRLYASSPDRSILTAKFILLN